MDFRMPINWRLSLVRKNHLEVLPTRRATSPTTNALRKSIDETLARFLQTTILGGVFFLAPIVVLIIILAKALEYANKVLQAFVVHILAASELSPTGATALSIVAVALVCFLAGLIAHTIVGQRLVRGLEDSVLSKVRRMNT
jgi:hypothetical protein